MAAAVAAEEERQRAEAASSAAAPPAAAPTAAPAVEEVKVVDSVEAVLDPEDRIAEQLKVHTESWQGKKDSQEDRFVQVVRLGKLGTAYGVFDGHGAPLKPPVNVWCFVWRSVCASLVCVGASH